MRLLLDRLLPPKSPTPVARGLRRDGLPLFAYGFRPFFLLAGLWAVSAMVLWIGSLADGWPLGGDYGAGNWHAHEMLFGYASAALAGFMLTAIPNWTGRLPVSGRPLALLALLWLAGRAGMLAIPAIPMPVAALVDAAFLPLLALIAGREIVAGRNWKNLKILFGLAALSLANIGFHLTAMAGSGTDLTYRLTISVFVMLVALVGGRIVPSFTRNWLSRHGAPHLPAPFGRFDQLALAATALALATWTVLPVSPLTAGLCAAAAAVQAVRLVRWHGWRCWPEPLVLVLHAFYAFLPLGLLAVAAAALGWWSQAPALHVFTIGVIGGMTLAVMTRASRGHTGRPLVASLPTSLAYAALGLAALCRPLAEVLPDYYLPLLSLSGGLWIAGFGLFTLEYAPMLLQRKLERVPAAAGRAA